MKTLINREKNVGNQPLSYNQQESLVSRLEPYLKSGMSIRKACLASGVSRATLYRLMEESEEVRDQILRFQDFISILTSRTIVSQLFTIHTKQVSGHKLDWSDLKFLMWFATNSRHCRDEFGNISRNKPSFDPQAEIRKLVDLIDNACGATQVNS